MRTHREKLATNNASALSLVLATLLAATLLAAILLVAKPAHADLTFTVNSTGDPGTGGCNSSECTLREAIALANRVSGTDTIRFGIPGSGVKTIKPSLALPTITEAVTIDGYTQAGSSPNTLAKGTNAKITVELDGSGAGAFADGLRISADNVVVRGLAINRFGVDGINVRDVANDPDNPTGVKIEGNFVGTDVTGNGDLGNGDDGVAFLDGKNNTVGGTAPAARNLISGNESAGLSILGGTSNTRVQGNLVGTKNGGNGNLGNGDDGVEIFGSNANTVGGAGPSAANTIAFNDSNGVTVGNGESSSDFGGNRILANSTFSNDGLGIDLRVGLENDGPNSNDPGDSDTGANGLQNKPVIASATSSGGKTTIQTRLSSAPNGDFNVQFFSNPSGEEGKKFIGDRAVSTGSDGKVSFTFVPSQAVVAGQNVTSTATNVAEANSSEFSTPRTVGTR